MPTHPTNPWLLAAAGLDIAAALAHLACILGGGAFYRAMGAGEAMAAMAEAGHWYSTVVTLFITGALLGFAACALAGAGILPVPPLLRYALLAITAIFALRGLFIVPALVKGLGGADRLLILGMGGPVSFWYWSSAICLGLALAHGLGLRQVWARLG